jgi:hypothetical protein
VSFFSQPITLQNIFGKDRKIGSITIEVVINENTTDVLTITKHPVQTGAAITDHAFKEPTTLSMNILFQDNLFTDLRDIYAQLLKLQTDRVPFSIITPKRIYSDMLLQSLGQTTDKNTENILSVQCTFQQLILVKVSDVQVDPAKQRNKQTTQATQDGGKKSSLLTLAEGVTGALGRR